MFDGKKLIVDSSRQSMEFWQDGEMVQSFKVSTSKNGIGCATGSLCTPNGRFRVVRKIGAGHPEGAVFRSRNPTGELWSRDPANPLSQSQEDLVLTRILWLAGTEANNINTLGRCIYIHGTNQEHLLGQPASHGCIRLSNKDIIQIFDLVEEGVLVQIG